MLPKKSLFKPSPLFLTKSHPLREMNGINQMQRLSGLLKKNFKIFTFALALNKLAN